VEDPGYPGAVFALKAAGARITPVPVDQEVWRWNGDGGTRLTPSLLM